MKKILSIAIFAAGALTASAAYNFNTEAYKYNNVNVTREGSEIKLTLDADLSEASLKSNQELIVIPALVSPDGTRMAEFAPIMAVGRNRYYYHLRHGDNVPDAYERNGESAKYGYSSTLPYSDWMKNSTLVMNYRVDGCCGEPTGSLAGQPLAYINLEPAVYMAEYVYIPPQAETVKIRQESGSAFIDFPVGKSVINADFRNNARELEKIANTINSVKNDKDVTMTGMSIKGFASPEGPYSLNARLAEARTLALKDYVEKLYNFKKDFIKTSWDPEDWGGLKAWLEKSDIENKAGILALVNSDLAPDTKDARIKKDFPTEYAFLLKNVYPSLRHSDYTVNFTVRSYTDVAEIIRVMQTDPRKLSLSELYTAAQSMKPGSAPYNETFELAARLFPNDETANLNAANSAMSKGDLISAERYLKSAGNSEKAQYARGVLEAQKKNYDKAKSIFSRLNLPEAKRAIQKLNEITTQPKGKVSMVNN